MSKSIGRATRPIFIPNRQNLDVKELDINFEWHLGMSSEVRKRSVSSLHKESKSLGFTNVLEASSKSSQEIGILLSAFYLKDKSGYPVENLFQSSKVFLNGGPYLELLKFTAKEAKREPKLKNSGEMIKFTFDEKDFPLEPKSLFYDWLYIKVLCSDTNRSLMNNFFDSNFDAFSDIEFNPKKSFSCQARTLALATSLHCNGKIDDFIENPIKISDEYSLYRKKQFIQGSLF